MVAEEFELSSDLIPVFFGCSLSMAADGKQDGKEKEGELALYFI